jgi:hypothetical protein
MGDGLWLDYVVARWPSPYDRHGQPFSAGDLVETVARLMRAIRGFLVLRLAVATHVPVRNSSSRDLVQSEI